MPKKSSSNNDGLSIQDRWKDNGKLKPQKHPDRNRRRYRVRVHVPNTKQYESETFDDAGKAKLWGQRRLAELRSGIDVAGTADLAVIAKEYVSNLRTVTEGEPGVSEGYAHHIELVIAGLVAAGVRDLKAPTFPSEARKWIAQLKPGWWAKLTDTRSPSAKRTTAISNVTRNRIVRELRTVCAYAVKTRRMLYNPALAVDSFKAAKRLRPQFDLAEIKLLVSDTARLAWSADRRRLDEIIKAYGGDKHAAAKELKVNVATIYNRLKSGPVAEDPWWLPACLLIYSGLRIAEAMHLRWQDIDWTGQRLRVRLQEAYSQKNDSERETILSSELKAILHPIAKPSGFIVESEAMRESGSALRDNKREYASRDYAHGFKRYLDRIGIQRNIGSGDRVPHSLRHSWVAMMLATGESASLVADWAGHSGDVQKLYRSQADAYHRDGARDWERGRISLRDFSDEKVKADDGTQASSQ